MVRMRPRNDRAYVETNFSEVISSWHEKSREEIEFLLGLRLAIVLPETEPDLELLESQLNFAAGHFGRPAIEVPRAELEEFLRAKDRTQLDNGYSVLVHCPLDRMRKKTQRWHPIKTDRANRVNDARQFMIAQAIRHLAHLQSKKPATLIDELLDTNTSVGAFSFERSKNGKLDALTTAVDAGNHSSVYRYFLPEGVRGVKSVDERFKRQTDLPVSREMMIDYWCAILRSALVATALVAKQASAHVLLSKTKPVEPYLHEDLMNFAGSYGPGLDPNDFGPIAHYDVHDIGHVVKNISLYQPLYECSALIGVIARGGRARISNHQSALLIEALLAELPMPSGKIQLDKAPLTLWQFLHLSMLMVRPPEWWLHHLRSRARDEAARVFLAAEDEIEALDEAGGSELAPSSCLAPELVALASKHGVDIVLTSDDPQFLWRIDSDGSWIVNAPEHKRFGHHAVNWLEDSIARVLVFNALEEWFGRQPNIFLLAAPYYFEDNIVMSTAVTTLLHRMGGSTPIHHEPNMAYWSWWLSDKEVTELIALGATIADHLLDEHVSAG